MNAMHNIPSIYVGALNNYEEVMVLVGRQIVTANSWIAKILRKAAVRNGLPSQVKHKKLEFFDLTEEEFKRINDTEHSVWSAMAGDNGWKPIAVISVGAVNQVFDQLRSGFVEGDDIADFQASLVDEYMELMSSSEDWANKMAASELTSNYQELPISLI